MNTQNTTRNRLGMLALLLAGILFAVTLLLRGPSIIDPTADPAGFARAVTSANHVTWALGTIVANALATLGVLALYSYLATSPVNRLAFAAMICVVLHDALFASFLGFNLALPAIGELYLQGQQAVIKAAAYPVPLMAILSLGSVLGLIGFILFGIAIWRSGRLPKWTAIPLALALPLLAFAPAASFFVAEFLGAVLWVVAAAGLLWGVWRPHDQKAG